MRTTLIPEAETIFGDRPWKLLQDSDPKHTARKVYRYLEEMKIDFILKSWLNNSPDLNPIENIWAILAAAINKNPPITMRQLKMRLKKEWSKIPQAHIDNAIMSMPKRIREIKKANSGPINY